MIMRKPPSIISMGLACTSLLPGQVGATIDRLQVVGQELLEVKQELVEAKQRFRDHA